MLSSLELCGDWQARGVPHSPRPAHRELGGRADRGVDRDRAHHVALFLGQPRVAGRLAGAYGLFSSPNLANVDIDEDLPPSAASGRSACSGQSQQPARTARSDPACRFKCTASKIPAPYLLDLSAARPGQPRGSRTRDRSDRLQQPMIGRAVAGNRQPHQPGPLTDLPRHALSHPCSSAGTSLLRRGYGFVQFDGFCIRPGKERSRRLCVSRQLFALC